MALVSYELLWSSSEWPGYVQCQADVLGADGDVIGGLEFETMSLQPDPPPALIDVPISSGVPDSASISCGDAHRPSASAGYVILNPTVEGPASDPRLVLEVAWATDESPLYQACEAQLRRIDGATRTYRFGLSVPPGRGEVLLTPELAGSSVLDVACHPFQSPGDGTQATDDMTAVTPIPEPVLLNMPQARPRRAGSTWSTSRT